MTNQIDQRDTRKVWTVAVRLHEPQHVGSTGDYDYGDEGPHERPEAGAVLDLEQCDGCGLTSFTVDTSRAFVTCTGEEREDQHFPGCGATYPLRLTPSNRTVW